MSTQENTNPGTQVARNHLNARRVAIAAKLAAIQTFCSDRSDRNRNAMFTPAWSAMATR